MIYEHDNSISFLKATLESKAKTNASYSMRAFAKKLNISAGGLSLILNGKKKLSVEKAHEIGQSLELNKDEVDYFMSLVQMEAAKSPALKMQYLEKIKALNPKLSGTKNFKQTLLSLEHFKLISDWYGLAILELVTVLKKPWTPTSIAKKMKLTKIEVENVLERLIKLELVEKNQDGTFTRIVGSVIVHSSVPAEGFKKYYMGLHEQSADSLNTQKASEKVIGSQVFAFDPDQLDEARKLTYKYLDDLNDLSRTGKNRTEIYQTLINIFRLTTEEKDL